MKFKLLVFLVVLCFVSCKSHSHKYNPEAIKLNDTAVKWSLQFVGNRYHLIQKAIALLDSATKIDSDYIIAYGNKFSLQMKIQHYKDAVFTGKQLMRLDPNNDIYKIQVGMACEHIGDTVTAKQYYKDGLAYFDRVLDTVNVSNKIYSTLVYEKAGAMILLHQQHEANGFLKTHYDKASGFDKELYQQEMNTTREKLLNENIIDTTTAQNNGKFDKNLRDLIKKAGNPTLPNSSVSALLEKWKEEHPENK